MKILAIRGYNLASLHGGFEIDFMVEPLRSAGIFAITGHTGSGKSTLLDAVCLALFDDTPRISRASENNIQINDVRDKTISQKDSRNILRRGTSEGYAEVDFVALSGVRYRSRWSVRRARDRADGVLQASEIRLLNLDTHVEEQGRKTELLAKVSHLIGLSFEQFTRAVLLAQGEFATFLKANQKEKAELLEKLTGTDVYSRISCMIYEHAKAAEQELRLVQERIKGVELLGQERLDELHAERLVINQGALGRREAIALLNAKLKWIGEAERLQASLKEAQQVWEASRKALEGAAGRHAYLAQIDVAQEARASFTGLQAVGNNLSQYKQSLKQEKELQVALVRQLEEASNEAETYIQLLKLGQEKAALLAPLLMQARELDVQLLEAAKLQEESQQEYKQALERWRRVSEAFVQQQTLLQAEKDSQKERDEWFDKHAPWSEVVARVDLILNLIGDATAASKQSKANSSTLQQVEQLLASEEKQQEALLKEQEHLNSLLPAEVVAWRQQLEEGMPCPVCGSLHHPASQEQAESADAAKLDVAKRKVAEQLAKSKTEVAERKAEQIRLQTTIDRYAEQHQEAMARLAVYLEEVINWQKHMEQGTLETRLKVLGDTWAQNLKEQAEAAKTITKLEGSLGQEEKAVHEGQRQVEILEKRWKERSHRYAELQGLRAQLLDGKPASEVDQAMQRELAKAGEQQLQATEKKTQLHIAHEKRSGTLQQLLQTIAQHEKQEVELKHRIEQWLAAKGNGMDMAGLAVLLTKDAAWILTERQALNLLQQQYTSAQATLAERDKALQMHALLENRPAEEEGQLLLEETLEQLESLAQQQAARVGEIDTILGTDAKNREKVQKYQQEVEEKNALAENWRKLDKLLGSADGNKFRQLAQGYTLDTLLAYANKQLEQLSSRYQLQRVPDTLALQVVDLDMLGEVRSVHSLSGGESFLLSLALALGLSSLSSNRMQIESLFIDEGFGSLDADTLRTAMDALEQLQTQGRKIGVISHVAEMNERIATKVQVVRASNGRSHIEIVG